MKTSNQPQNEMTRPWPPSRSDTGCVCGGGGAKQIKINEGESGKRGVGGRFPCCDRIAKRKEKQPAVFIFAMISIRQGVCCALWAKKDS